MFFEPPKLWLSAVECGILASSIGLAYLALKDTRPFPRPRWLIWLLSSERRSVLFVILTAMTVRAILLPWVGIPEPRVNDEFAHLLAADTFSHGRLTNPTPANWEHFETFHVNIRPTYHSIYPVGQGLVLAFGQVVCHQPWIGVYLSTALMCGAICWSLRAFFSPGWALLGGLMAMGHFALFSYWMNSYWGGSVAALGGALALGAVVRLCENERSSGGRALMSGLFSMGLLVLANSRPYEGFAYSLPLLAYLAYILLKRRSGRKQISLMLFPALVIGLAGLVGMGVYNKATTGNALVMPYMLNHQTYWRLPFFAGQKENSMAVSDDPAFVKFFELTAKAFEYDKTKSAQGLLEIEGNRIFRNWIFYVGPALTFPVLIGFVSCLRQARLRIAAILFAAVSLACALCLFNFQHYFAPATIVMYIFAIEGLRNMWDLRHYAERAFVVGTCAAVAITSCLSGTPSAALYTRFGIPDARKAVLQQLKAGSTRYVVLVSYDFEKHYPGAELVHNGAEFGSEGILWARSKGRESDLGLCTSYPDRTFVGVTTDDTNLSFKVLQLCDPPFGN
jgi:hypothetical protein